MGVHHSPQTFVRGSTVLDYWLAHGQGFRIHGGRRRSERVEAVHVDPATGRARTLVLRSLLHRRRAVEAEAVAAVDPFARVLVLPQPERPSRLAAATAQVVVTGRWAQPHAARGAAAAARGGRAAAATGLREGAAAARWLRPRLVHAGVLAALAGREAARGLAAFLTWLRPRLAASSRRAVAATGAGAVVAAEALRAGAARAKRRDGPDLQADR